MITPPVGDEIVDTHRLVSYIARCHGGHMVHDSHDIHLTTEAARHPEVFAAAFNSGDPATLELVYEPDAPLIAHDGSAKCDRARREANDALQALRIPIRVFVRQVHENADLALLVVDWAISGESPLTGRSVNVSGTATDIARRGPDGLWRYVIDNPFGVATGSV